MADTKPTRAERKEQKAKERVARLTAYAKNTSADQLKQTYKFYKIVVIAFFVFFVLSVFFRPWFYSVILAVLIWRENRKKKDANIAYFRKTGTWLKEPKDPVKYMM